MYITRFSEKELKRLLLSPKVIIIIGARQVGKTTLVRYVLKGENVVFLNLDIEIDKQRLEALSALPPNEAWKALGNPKILVVDEAQRFVDTGRIIKGWYDSNLPLKVILLGSSSLNLLSQSAESLTGRNEKLFLTPLVFREIVKNQEWYSDSFSEALIQKKFSKQLHENLMQNMVFGSYPEVVLSGEKEDLLQGLVSDYLLKDVLQLGLIKTPVLIKKLLMALAYQVGSLVSINELSSTLGVARQTIERYLDILEQTYVIFKLPAHSSNPRKEISKSNKIYFWDTGVRNALINDFSLNEQRTDIGALWENWVISEVAKQNLILGQHKDLYFWRSKRGGEVDLVIKKDEKINAYEIKWKSKKGTTSKLFSSTYNTEIKTIDSSGPLIMLG